MVWAALGCNICICIQAEEPQRIKTVLAKWVESRRLISEEKYKWKLEREMLNDRINLVQNERDALHKKINDTRSLITDSDTKRADLVEENNALKNTSVLLEERVDMLESRILELLPLLPEPVQNRIRPLSQRISEKRKSDQPLSVRYQNVIGIVNDLNKQAVEIRMMSEVKERSDGPAVEVQTVYIGFARAYYCNNKGDMAGFGYPASEGWKWKEDNTLASKVSEVIAVLKNEKTAKFIPLPVSVNEGFRDEKER